MEPFSLRSKGKFKNILKTDGIEFRERSPLSSDLNPFAERWVPIVSISQRAIGEKPVVCAGVSARGDLVHVGA